VVPIFTTTMMKRLLGLLGDNTKEVSVAEKAIGGQRWVAVVGGSACFLGYELEVVMYGESKTMARRQGGRRGLDDVVFEIRCREKRPSVSGNS
jgi:hypothetical protein